MVPAAESQTPTRGHSRLRQVFALALLALGIAGLAIGMHIARRCFGAQAEGDLFARLAQDHATVRLALQTLIPIAIAGSLTLAAAGLGLWRGRRWALKLAVGYAVAGLASILLGVIIIATHFRQILKPPTGFTKAKFSIALSHAVETNVTVAYKSVPESAAAGLDFTPVDGLVTFNAGQTSKDVTVIVNGDSDIESSPETFSLALTNAVHAALAQPSAQATIRDDDDLPGLSVGNISVRERNHGNINARFHITLSHASETPVVLNYATADSNATANVDYIPTNGTLTIPAWQTETHIDVPVSGDIDTEDRIENFFLVLTNPRGAVLQSPVGTGQILDNEGTPALTIRDAAITELDRDNVTATFHIFVSRPYPTILDVTYTTTNHAAIAGKDYIAAQGRLRFHARQTNLTVNVEILPDYKPERGGETFGLLLTPTDTQVEAVDVEGICTIRDNDGTPALSIENVTITEGDPADKPVTLALGRMIAVGGWIGTVMTLIIPIGILWFVSRTRVLLSMGIDPNATTYTVGTLTYTKLGLTALFAWLLWGEFCWTIMEAVVPSVLPFKLKALQSPNTLMVVILSTLPSILNLTICPWVSFKSDRYRSRWGRRIPFILWTMPFLAASLVMLGWSVEISAWIRGAVPAAQVLAPNTMTIAVIAVLMVIFQFFNMFVNSVFWYLFNDVVPAQFLGRFMGLFRLMGTAAGAIYNAFIFGYAETHMREILSGAAVLYFVGFGIVCLRVKEGDYPEIAGEPGKPKTLLGDIRTFGKESFSVPFYWYLYLTGAFSRVTYALAIFGVFMSKEMGLTVAQMGKLGAAGSIAGMIATYFTAVLVDRWHPMRITVYEKIFTAVGGYGGWIWLYVTLPGDLFFWLSMGGLVGVFNYQLTDAAGIPLLMRILPKSRYGQFSSAAAMIRSFALIVGGILAGLFMDFLRWLCDGSDYSYRLAFTWVWPFSIVTTVLTVMVYQSWKRHGGDIHYRPPAPWHPDGVEEVVDKVQSVPMKPRAVVFALNLGLTAAILNIIIIVASMYYMHLHVMNRAFWWHAWVLVPIKVFITFLTWRQIVSVKRDIVDLEAGRSPKYGVPHHGVFLVQAITGLFYFPVYWMQTLWMIKIDYEMELILFGVNTLLGGFAGLLAVQLIRWIERVQPTVPATPAPTLNVAR